MQKYYLIPTTETDVYLNGKSLRSILEENYPQLLQRENERIKILYSISPLVKMPESVIRRYNQHKAETKRIYDEMKVPEFLIAKGNDHYAKEILTNVTIKPNYPAALGICEVTKEAAERYYYSSDYRTKIANYSGNISSISENPFEKEYNINAAIEGEIDGKNIKGNFNGTIKIRRLTPKK